MSPSQILARTLAWWRETFTTTCAHALDVRREGARVECGKCGASIRGRA